MTIREQYEGIEKAALSPFAAFSTGAGNREKDEEPCPLRTPFQRDRDRIIHCKSFRRLKHKTQVFMSPCGDHFRTRLTHTLEVSQIARTIARALRLNEDLTEAVSLGHDLGHTPFGHCGERTLNTLFGGFCHNEQSLRVVDLLEKDGKGLNLTAEVRDGILNHTGDGSPKSLEGAIVRYADRIAYINHDIDDALRFGVLKEGDIPRELQEVLGFSHSQRISTLIIDIVMQSQNKNGIFMSPKIETAMLDLREFLSKAVYKGENAKSEEQKAEFIIKRLYEYFCENPDKMPVEFLNNIGIFGVNRVVCDYIAGMTDRYAIAMFEHLSIPGTVVQAGSF